MRDFYDVMDEVRRAVGKIAKSFYSDGDMISTIEIEDDKGFLMATVSGLLEVCGDADIYVSFCDKDEMEIKSFKWAHLDKAW